MKRLVSIILLSLFLAFAGCTKQEGGKPHTGEVIPSSEIRNMLAPLGWQGNYGSQTYAKVDEAWLAGFYDRYRSHMFSAYSVVRWDAKADCDFWAQQYAAHAKAEFFNASFHEDTKAEQVAVGEFWYAPNPATPHLGHAINVLVTNRGVVFIEPQTGKRVNITREQIAGGYFLRF